MCRKVFLVAEEMLLAPKIYSPISNFLLHIIDNDTGEELDILFNRAAPHIYQPNKVDLEVTFTRLSVSKVHIPVSLFIFSNSATRTNEILLFVPSLFSGVIPSLQRPSPLNRHQLAPSGECAWSVKRNSFQNQPTSLLSIPSPRVNIRIITFPTTTALYVGRRIVAIGVDSFVTNSSTADKS